MLPTARRLCGALLALQLLTSNVLTPHTLLPLHASALPITSKPIESTAENLAWQAWLMLPQEQKNLEKSRKVTPKSIFTLPFRECPPGHQLYETRCIPTVHIDQGALLTQQLLGFVIGDANAEQNYEFDYEDEEMVMYEPPQRLSSDVGAQPQLPVPDEPLKFNIFQQKFPTDYDAESGSLEGSGGAAMAAAKPSENRTAGQSSDANFMDALKDFLERQANATQNAHNNNGNISQHNHNNSSHQQAALPDLQSESSNISANVAAVALPSSSSEHIFGFGGIDAIALPAAAPTTSSDLVTPQAQRISLFKDDSAVQLVTSVISNSETATQPQQHEQQLAQDLTQLLKVDALLPLSNVTQAAAKAHNATAESLQVATPHIAQTEDDVTGTPPWADVEQTTTLDELLSAAEQTRRQDAPQKAERTRSVTDTSGAWAQEESFSTTVEPVGTTNIQLDETTIIEAHEPTAFVRQELQTQTPRVPPNHVVLKKSKVEADEWAAGMSASGDGVDGEEEGSATSSVMPAAITDTATTTTAAKQETTTKAAETATETLLNIVKPAAEAEEEEEAAATDKVAAASTLVDRFAKPHLGVPAQPDQQQRVRTVSGDVGSSSATKLPSVQNGRGGVSGSGETSEINIEQELRMINALVKGKRQPTAKATTTTAEVATQETTTTIESSLTAATEDTKMSEAEAIQSKAATATTAANSRATTTAATTTTTNALNENMHANKIAETVAKTQTQASSSSTTESTITTATVLPVAATTTTEASATIWSKIMPVFGWSDTAAESTVATANATTVTTSNQVAAATADIANAEQIATKAVTTTTSSDSTSTSSSSNSISPISSISSSNNKNNNSNNRNRNRSNRNSKFSRMSTAQHLPSSQQYEASSTETTPLPAAAATNPTTTAATITTTSTEAASAQSFWWLPPGWRLDGGQEDEQQLQQQDEAAQSIDSASSPEPVPPSPTFDNDYDAAAQSLLLRFWSAFPGNQAKVKE